METEMQTTDASPSNLGMGIAGLVLGSGVLAFGLKGIEKTYDFIERTIEKTGSVPPMESYFIIYSPSFAVTLMGAALVTAGVYTLLVNKPAEVKK